MQSIAEQALKARFDALSQEDRATLDLRSTFRGAPIALAYADFGRDDFGFARCCHLMLRHLLCVGVAAASPSPEMKRAALAAAAEIESGGVKERLRRAASERASADVIEVVSEALQLDFLMIEGGPICPFVAPADRSRAALTATELRAQPIWHEGAPAFFTTAWSAVRERLLGLDIGFEVWTGWVELRLDGWPVVEPWERAWALASPEAGARA